MCFAQMRNEYISLHGHCKVMPPPCVLQEVAEYAAREQKRKEMKEAQAQAYIGAVRIPLCLPNLRSMRHVCL